MLISFSIVLSELSPITIPDSAEGGGGRNDLNQLGCNCVAPLYIYIRFYEYTGTGVSKLHTLVAYLKFTTAYDLFQIKSLWITNMIIFEKRLNGAEEGRFSRFSWTQQERNPAYTV